MRHGVAALIVALAAIGRAEAALVIAAATVNGYSTGIVLQLDQHGDHFTADAAALDAIGLVVPSDANLIDLETIRGVTFGFRADAQSLAIIADSKALKPHSL